MQKIKNKNRPTYLITLKILFYNSFCSCLISLNFADSANNIFSCTVLSLDGVVVLQIGEIQHLGNRSLVESVRLRLMERTDDLERKEYQHPICLDSSR